MDTTPQQRLTAAVAALCTTVPDTADASATVTGLTDESLLAGLTHLADARRALDVLGATFTAEVDRRSARDLGYDGLAQRTGHGTGTSLVQSVTGQTRIDVRRAVEAGSDLAQTRALSGEPIPPDASGDLSAAVAVWFAPLTDALANGTLSREQYDVIRRGLGDPPTARYPDVDPAELVEQWRELASVLVEEAGHMDVENLASAARLARDTRDPVGTAARCEEHFRRRSFRRFTDRDGQHGARILFTDDDAAFIDTVRSAALRPRRGPRFVDPAQQKAAEAQVADDDRTNEQLEYDTVLALFRTGSLADPAQAFGDRAPGVRVIMTVDRDAGSPGAATGETTEPVPVGVYEETGQALPATMVEKYLCDTGSTLVTIDEHGTPLDVGRERRRFTKKQRDALAIRDGGCRWCGAEPSRCEAHHIVPWSQGGRTDLRDGILLCRNCHMRLHNNGWWISRAGREYWLHPPRGAPPTLLPVRSLVRFRRAG